MGYDRDEKVKAALEGAVRSGSKGWFIAPCPFCAGSRGNPYRKCFGILAAVGIYRCFRCEIKGKLHDMEDTSEEFRTAPSNEPEAPPVFEPPEGFTSLEGDRSLSLQPAREYLDKRGIGPELVHEAQLGACAWGKYSGRVVAPVLDFDRQTWLGFSARSWLPRGSVEQPYLNPGGMLKGHIFYNGAIIHEKPGEPLFVCEGIFDALALWDDASAFLGKPSEFQEDLLVECPRPVISVLDGDAWRESEALAWRLQMRGKRAGWIRLPPGEDPSTMGKAWIQAEARHAL